MKAPFFADLCRIVNFLVDLLLFIFCQILVFKLRFQAGFLPGFFSESVFLSLSQTALNLYLTHFITGICLFVFLGISFGLYSGKIYINLFQSFKKLSLVCLSWVVLCLFVAFFFKVEPSISRSFVILSGWLSFLTLCVWKKLLKSFIHTSGLMMNLQERVLVIGNGPLQTNFLKRLESHPAIEYRFVEHVAIEHSLIHDFTARKKYKSVTFEDVKKLIESRHFDAILLADNNIGQEKISLLVQVCHQEMVRFIFIPMFFEVLISGLHIKFVQGVPLVGIGKNPLDKFINRLIKRTLDIIGSIVGLVIFWPVIVLFLLLVYWESPGPVFYSQTRAGRSDKKFKIYKIRSMRMNAETSRGPQWTKENDSRRLLIGAFMRRWNIDELPQFWNVLKGDMSLVGPRPERPMFIKDFKRQVEYYNLRHTIKPGITGWAAINGWRGNTDLNERIRFDLDYIEHWSLWFDIKIMLLTFLSIKNAY